jgi:trk system potassium uptake protein TrkA
MKIVIIGGGKVGFAIAREMSGEGHDITIIDNNRDNVESLSVALDGMVILGDGNSLEAQRAANVGESDLMIAATPNDEVNILCCILARKLGCRNNIARIRRWEYMEEMNLLQKELGLSMTVTPDGSAARELFRLLQFPGFLKRGSFSKSRVEIVGVDLNDKSILNGKQLSELPRLLKQRILICAVKRGEETTIPTGAFRLQAGDELLVTAPATELSRLMEHLGLRTKKVRNVMIVGGSRVGINLARMLCDADVRVKLIDKGPEKCRMLAEALPDVQVICADGTRQEVLRRENISQMDAVVALTNMDEENVFICMYANMMGVSQAIPKINRTEYVAVCQNCGIRSIVTPKDICAQEITRYVRAMQSSDAGSVLSMYTLMDGRVEALEFEVTGDVPHLGERLADVRLKPNILLCCITRQGKVIFPGGGDSLQKGDIAVVVTTRNRVIVELRDIFAD